MKRLIVFISAVLFFSGLNSMAHGIHTDVSLNYPMVITKSYYSASHPLKKASISIYSPGDKEEPYYTGFTDPAGYFAFAPNLKGDWTVIIDDQQGHKKETVITINKVFFDEQGQEAVVSEDSVAEHTHSHTHAEEEAGRSNLFNIILGLAIIFGITGILYGLKAKQQLKK